MRTIRKPRKGFLFFFVIFGILYGDSAQLSMDIRVGEQSMDMNTHIKDSYSITAKQAKNAQCLAMKHF